MNVERVCRGRLSPLLFAMFAFMLGSALPAQRRRDPEPPTIIPPGPGMKTSLARPLFGSPTRRIVELKTAGGGRGGESLLDSAVVLHNQVRILLAPLPRRFRHELHGAAGFFSWRLDVNEGPGFSVVLAADTMMQTTSIGRIIKASTLRRCGDPNETAAARCTLLLPAKAVQARGDYVQFVFEDSATVNFFRGNRPRYISATAFEPRGKFHVEMVPIAYHDGLPPVVYGQTMILR